MDRTLFDRLTRLDAFETLDRGTKGVRVSLQSQSKLEPGSRAERRMSLQRRFADVAEDLARKGARIDLHTLSVSAQTVEAVLPVDQYDEVKHDLEEDGIRVDPVIDRQIVE